MTKTRFSKKPTKAKTDQVGLMSYIMKPAAKVGLMSYIMKPAAKRNVKK